MSTTAPADAREALDMIRAGLGYLAAADPGQLPATTQAERLRELEQHDAAATVIMEVGSATCISSGSPRTRTDRGLSSRSATS